MQHWLFLILCLAWHAVGLPTPDDVSPEALDKFADMLRKTHPIGMSLDYHNDTPNDSSDDAPDNVPDSTPENASDGTSDNSPENLPTGNDIPSNPVVSNPPNSTLDTDAKNGTGFISAAYFVNWAIYARKHNPQDIPADKLTHVMYAFANIRPDGEVFLTDPWSDTDKRFPEDGWAEPGGSNVFGCIKQIFLKKKQNRSLKVLLSIGGWTYSKNFAVPTSTEAGRRKFAQTAVKIMVDVGFDGIDIDWEYPENEQQANDYVSLLQAVREELNRYKSKGKTFLLTIASPAGPTKYSILKLSEMNKHLDFFNLMAYDYAGSWDHSAGHNANLHHSQANPTSTPFNTDQAIDHYIAHGVPSKKIILGMPLYGRAFFNTEGPGKPFSGVGQGSWEVGVWDVKALPRPGHQVTEMADLGAAFSYDPGSKMMVSFDTPAVTKMKAAYIKSRGLGGGMWWETSGDRAEGGLISTLVGELGGVNALEKSQNQLDYPDSRYENLRKQFVKS